MMGNRGAAGGNLRGKSAGDIIPKGYNVGQLQQFNPQQMQLFQQLFGHVGQNSQLSGLASGDQSQFEQMEAPAMRQFQGLLGQNASRFSGLGMGSRQGSGFQNSTNQITSDFAQDLASKRMGLQRQALMDLFGISESLLGQRPQDRFLAEKPQRQPSWFESLIGGLGQGAGALGGLYGANKLGFMGGR